MKNKHVNTNRVKRVSIDKRLKFFLALFIVILLICNGINIYIIYYKKKYTYKNIQAYNCYNTAKISYKVNLLPNKIYSENQLEEGNVYIRSLVDCIDTNLKYEFSGEKSAVLSGSYNVLAVLEGYINDEKKERIMWQKQYLIKPETAINSSKSSYILESKIPINIKEYKDFADNAQRSINTSFNTRVRIVWNLNIDIKTNKGSTSKSFSPNMIIPLNNECFQISGDLSQQKKGIINEKIKVLSDSYKNIDIWYWLEGVLAALQFLLLSFTKIKKEENTLQKRIKNIFSNYGDRIIVINEALKYGSKYEISLSSIEDMVKVSDDLNKPILYEKISFINDILTFYILDYDYVYILNLEV